MCINMNIYFLFFILCLITRSESRDVENIEVRSLTKQNSTEPNKWNIKSDINFTKTLPPLLRRKSGTDVKLRCEAVINFTRPEKLTKNNEKLEISLDEFPPEYKKNLMKVKVNWRKDNNLLKNESNIKYFTKIYYNNETILTVLKIRNIQLANNGNYSCHIEYHYKQIHNQTRIIVEDEGSSVEIPTFHSLFPDSLYTESANIKLSTAINTQVNEREISSTTVIPKSLEPICQEYVGSICARFLGGQFVYIPYFTTQNALEDKLFKALQVTKYSNDISLQCQDYALPSLCYSSFPICRDPAVTNYNFKKVTKQIIEQKSQEKMVKENDDEPKIVFENLPKDGLPNHLSPTAKPVTEDPLDFRYNSTVLRRVCKQECEILENELCQKEYSIAKRHPHIGQQLTLEDCADLPEHDPDCLKLGISPMIIIRHDDECYWENGVSYLGKVNVANNGMPCIEWSKQFKVKPSDYPELVGRHSYCSNPGGLKTQPWCFVDNDGKTEQLCDIPKCAHKIWIYIVIIFFLVTFIITGLIICIYCKNKSKNNATTIMDINLPNADKNIYGNSRLNSPIELNDMLSNNMGNPMNPNRNVRGNGILRIPQYSLSQIRFLEELGEGAFGKVYKGALSKGGDTLYVAVKALKENASSKTQADFRREIDLISELRHDNIVCIVGVALREEPLCMLFEFMARGDLHEFLMGRAPPSGKGLPAMRLLNIAYNIASGMHYLASHHYVHRDLAARNCLVSDDFVVKISDFGLSRDIYSSDYYRVQSKSLLPVRWMPPESILYGKFTTESDIWSYGVVLWEIYSYGLQPYYGFSNQEVISMVRGGELLACPTSCPAAVYALMQDTWRHTPQRRPNFEDIVNRIQTWIDSGGCPEIATSESGSVCSHRHASTSASSRELLERVPLLPPHTSHSSCGSLPPAPCHDGNTAPRKKGSCGSLIDTDKSTRDTVVRIPNTRFGNEI